MTVLPPDLLGVMRDDLRVALDDVGLPYYAAEPRAVTDAPSAWIGRPSIVSDDIGKRVVCDWPLTIVGTPVDLDTTMSTFDEFVWALVSGYGAGLEIGIEHSRTIRFYDARPTTVVSGDLTYPAYVMTVRTTVPLAIC